MGRYLTRRQVADEYHIGFSTLAHMAAEGRGPPFSIVATKAIYHSDHVERWIEDHQIDLAARQGKTDSPLRGRPRKSRRYRPPSAT